MRVDAPGLATLATTFTVPLTATKLIYRDAEVSTEQDCEHDTGWVLIDASLVQMNKSFCTKDGYVIYRQHEVDIQAWQGKRIQLCFALHDDDYWARSGWYVDQVEIH